MDLRSRLVGRSILVLLVALCAGACSGSATTTVSEPDAAAQPEPTAAAAEPTPAPTSASTPTAASAEPTPVPEPTATPEPTAAPEPPTVYFASELQVGDCFNRLAGNPSFQPPDIVSCDELHDEEVFAKALLGDPDGTPYPGEDAIAERVAVELCDQATIDFAGAPWSDIPVSTFLLYPLEEEWDAGDRNIMCTAAAQEDGTQKIGTAAGGSIQSNDVLMARAGLANDGVDFTDWVIVTQRANVDTVGSLTDAQFDLPLRRPFGIPFGFMFHARATGDDGHATTSWGYNWENQQFTDLGSILPGQELSSLAVADGAVIFSARATPDDDFDLWSTISGDAQVIAGGPGNQQYATLTPDQTRVVYHDNGDIWVAGTDGSAPLQLTSGPANDWESTVSPDGQTVVFASDRSGNDDLWAVDIAGGEPVNLTNHPADESWPVFSEDGQYLYFSSDRLDPVDDRSILMVMSPDGSNQSWFASINSGQAIVVPQAIADTVLATAPTLVERYNYELIEGEPGTTATWTHSNGRLAVDLPVGWRVGELDDGSGFLAGPRPEKYFETWDVDGVEVSLKDGETEESFFALLADTQVQSCDQFDGTNGIVPIAEGIVGLSANFNCGSNGSVGGVIGFYNQVSGVGVLLQGQRDNLPDVETDSDMLTAIALSLLWE